jgi:hypothetical protein
VHPIVEYGTSPGKYTSSAEGEENSYRYLLYKSANIHHVVIGPLEADTIYYYRCGGNGPEYSFKTPPAQLPIAFAVVGEFQKKTHYVLASTLHPFSIQSINPIII